MLKKTKIIATIGPSSSSPSVIAELISKGVDIFRLNFSHGTHQILLQAIKDIRQQQTFLNKEIGILADLQGPKIRTGRTIDDKPVTIQKGAIVRLTSEKSSPPQIPFLSIIQDWQKRWIRVS